MTLLNRYFVRVFSALFSTALVLAGAEMEMLPGNFVRVGVSSQSQRVAVDVSRNLFDWMQLTNIAPAAGQITFANDPLQSDPARFFRTADADETFAVAGFFDGGPYFGGMADASVWQEKSAVSVKTDRNGFFHFNDRYYRTNFPMQLYAASEGLVSPAAAREIRSADAGSFVILSAPLGAPSLLNSVGDQTYHFYVTGGARAGLEYFVRFHGGQVSITGGISAEGTFREIKDGPPFRYVVTLSSNTNVESEMFFWPIRDTMNQGFGYFSGIPGTNGTITGNGMITWDTTPVAPSGLEGLAFALDDNKIQFNNGYDLVWNGAYSAGAAVFSREGNKWTVEFSPFGGGSTNTLQLYFATATNGSYTIQRAGQQVSGAMQQIPYLPWIIDPNGEVQPLSTIKITVEEGGVGSGLRYTVSMHAGNFLAVTDAGDIFGSGTFTYTPIGTRFAHLRLDYSGAAAGDFDDMNLEFRGPAGSTIPSIFTGTQLLSTTQYLFRGTFLY